MVGCKETNLFPVDRKKGKVIMNLSDFRKVNTCCRTFYSIVRGDDVIDSIVVDITEDLDTLFESLCNLNKYDDSKVVVVGDGAPNDGLYVLCRV